ncbi:TraB/GumN family protein [Qipengyuania gelatinilytica]|uniref:TraB/GumN family protein n=1 Tax=Qipengyuania gelatinilytica TaxID=2867231 RepID=A0ABX9A2Y4_9SPHN|nr:TraB/GumN family protein [Qipengyuania gelatinilytica]QZD95484.1 TraB/GumN family protein [Qipengyuania gelatinilytica]
MKAKQFFRATAAGLTLFALQACSTLPDEAAVAAVAEEAAAELAAERGPALWKVADEDTTIYIFGTVHALPAEVDWYSGPVKAALDSSGSLVTEVDMTPEVLASMGQTIAAKGMFNDGRTLRGVMTDEQQAKFEAGIAKLGIPAEALDPLEPWFAAINIAQILLQSAGYDGENGVEKVLEATVAEGTERVALETVDFQLSIFDELPMENQIAFLLQTVEDPQAGIAMLDSIIAEWAEGDAEALGNMLQEANASDPLVTARLFHQRNANWAGWIDERLDTPGTAFMAVGAGHLAGENSVQDYLGQRGISVSRIQ